MYLYCFIAYFIYTLILSLFTKIKYSEQCFYINFAWFFMLCNPDMYPIYNWR